MRLENGLQNFGGGVWRLILYSDSSHVIYAIKSGETHTHVYMCIYIHVTYQLTHNTIHKLHLYIILLYIVSPFIHINLT